MKNKKICYFTNGNLSSSVIAALLLLVMSTGLFAESLPPPDVWQQSFDRSVFDYHFSRADRETSPERWMEQAKQGMGFAKSAWEEMVFVLYEDINLFQEDSQKLDAWSEDELERRFSQWLVKRFFADDSSELVIETSRKVRSSNLNLLYYLDESGNIIYDELSGDPFVIRPDNDTRDFSSDKILYNDEIDKASKENFFTYTKRLEEYFPELLSFIQEDRRTDFEEKLKGVLFKTQENLAEEFERAKTREDRIFTSLRTGDIWSLRKKSDKEAAGIISAELILETEALCEKGIAELQQRIDRALADSESLVLDGEEWLSQYTDQFYRGLQAWQDAEERFFIRRIEWEQSAGQYWLEGQEAWLSAFNTLAGEKEKWEIKTQELFKAGEALFKNVSLELEQSITKAREEFITEAALRAQSAGERAGAYLDTYISCGTLLSSAQSFIDFWLADMGDEGKNAPQLSDKSFKAWMEAHGITEQSNDSTKREIYKWYSLYNTYLSLALNARNILIEDFYLVMGEGRLIDVLNANASGEDFYLDEYQVELLRAQAVSNYWAKRLEMAQAVNDYAVELSAGRTTNIEGIQNWEKAKSEYDSALKEYESEIENLKNAENDLIGAKAGINEAYEHLSEAEFALNNLNEKYSILQSIYSIKDAQEIVFDEMSKKYKEILLYEEKLSKKDNEAVYLDYLSKKEYIGYKEFLSSAYTILSELVMGSDEDLSLSQLNTLYETIFAPENADEIPDSIDGFGIHENAENYPLLLRLFLERANLLEEIETFNEDEEFSGQEEINETNNQNEMFSILELYNALIIQAASGEKERAWVNLENRKSAIRLLSAPSTSRWFFDEINYVPDDEDMVAFYNNGLEKQLREYYLALSEEYNNMYDSYADLALSPEIIKLQLSEYDIQIKRALGLIEVYNKCKEGSKAVIEEINLIAKKELHDFFIGIGIQTGNTYLPDIETITEVLTQDKDTFIINAVRFIYRLNDIFNRSSFSISVEISEWLNLFIDYISDAAVLHGVNININEEKIIAIVNENNILLESYPDDAMELMQINNFLFIEYQVISLIKNKFNYYNEDLPDKKNWREYLDSDFLLKFRENNPALVFNMSWSSFIQSNMADTVEQLNLKTNMINDWLKKESRLNSLEDYTVFLEKIENYMNETDTNREYSCVIDHSLYNDLDNSAGLIRSMTDKRRLLNEEFAQLGISYELAKASRENIKIQIEVLSEEIKAAKNEYDAELLSYSAAANEFERRGNVYQTIYSQTKKQSGILEEKRFEYEKQDAIQRWASTAYLSNSYDYGVDRAEYKNPAQELLYSKERYDRSEIILAALKDLYDNGEKYRKYEDSEYQRIYNEYKEIFERLIFSIKIKDVLENEIKKESLKNTELYLGYKDFFESLSSDFIVRQDDSSEQAALIKELLSIISVDALGNLSFKRDNGSISKRSGNETDKLLEYFSLPMNERQEMENSPAYSEEMIRLLNYFALEEKRGVETHESAKFELATRNLVKYLSETLSNVEKYKQWSLARDYLVLEAARSTDSPLLKQAVYHPDNSLQEGIFSTMPAKYIFFEFSEIKEVTYKAESLENIQRDAYNSLGEEEKRALEFYTILTLAGGGGKASRSFTYASKFVEFEYLYNLVDSEARAAADKRRACLAAAFFIFFIDPHMIALSVLYNNAEKQLNATKNQLTSPLNESKDIIFGGAVSLLSESNSLLGFFDQYYRSSERLAKLRGECADDTELQWQDIQLSLESTGTINNTDILKIKTYWEDFQRVNKTRCESVPDALAKIIAWSRIERKVQLASLEEKWAADELSRLENQKTYRDLSDVYIENESGYEELSSMLDLTYGSRASAQKNHILTLGNTIMDNLYGIIGKGEGYTQDRIDMAVEYVNTINRAYQERLNAELTEREIEWEQQRIGLYKKYEAWKESAGLILEYGRLDWKNSGEIMALRYNNWKKAFNEEYAQIGEEWDAAYLQGLQDKEQWLEEVNRAVNNASVNALLALIGANAEQKARVLDTRDPFGVFPLDALPESGRVLSEILNSAGISNTENAFNALNAITGTISTQTKSGTGSVYVWDSGIIQAQAQRLAKKANDDLAERQSKMLSANVRRIADQIKSGILANIQNANNNFRESMDNMFIFEGQWSRSGRNYIKDVIVHSTLSDPVITERVFVEGYRDFALSAAGLSLDLETDISDERLNGLSSFAINAIIQEIQDEIKTKTVKIFGNDTLVKGAFYVWTGDSPVLIENPSHKNSMEDNFQNQGSGELGRLRRHYIHWSIKETNGIGLLNTAAWDKPMWDSRDSWFDAPSFRTVNEIGAAIAATVVTSVVTFGTMAPVAALLCTAAISAAIATADDFLFAVADGIGGYKDWDEAFFDYGQAFAISSASSLISAGFSGMGSALGTSTQAGVNAAGTAAGTSVTSSLGNSMAHTLINGAQTLASSTVTSALDAVSYRNGQWGFSKEVFRNGAFNGLKSLAGSMPGTFVKSTLNSGLNGFVNDLFKDGTKLSDLVGGISTQSINYALGGDFTVNLLNLGLFTDNALSSGLLELHLGRERGASVNLGSGGVNFSIDNLVSSVRGMEAWLVNGSLLLSNEDESGKLASQLRTLYSRGGVERDEFENILAGKTNVIEDIGVNYTRSLTEDGIKTITLGNSALSTGALFDLNIILSHEAYRNGLDDGVQGQQLETERAVAGHIATTNALLETYGNGAVSMDLIAEAALYNYAVQNNFMGLTSMIFNNYDSGSDYWKLTHDGGLINDGQGYLKDEDGYYINKDGSRSSKIIKGMTIGAAGLETGLLNILYGGSSGKAYGEFNDSQVLMTQYIMKQAGIAQTSKDVVGFRDALWEKGNGGQELNMLDVMIRNGNSISNQVFTQYYDTAVNIQIANDKGKDIGNFPHAQIIPSLFPRYLDLYNTKKEFFDNIKDVLNGDLNYYISGEFGDQYNGHYAYYNYKHYGIDLSREGGPSNDPIYTGIAGKITDKNWSYAANGNSTQIEYGYTFEGSFSSTGLYGEYLHMKDETIYPVGTILESTIQIGQVAGTPNYDPHLHYDILSKKSYSESTLALLLGKDALQSSFSSIDNKKTVYDPALFYKNWLNKSLLVKK